MKPYPFWLKENWLQNKPHYEVSEYHTNKLHFTEFFHMTSDLFQRDLNFLNAIWNHIAKILRDYDFSGYLNL